MIFCWCDPVAFGAGTANDRGSLNVCTYTTVFKQPDSKAWPSLLCTEHEHCTCMTLISPSGVFLQNSGPQVGLDTLWDEKGWFWSMAGFCPDLWPFSDFRCLKNTHCLDLRLPHCISMIVNGLGDKRGGDVPLQPFMWNQEPRRPKIRTLALRMWYVLLGTRS